MKNDIGFQKCNMLTQYGINSSRVEQMMTAEITKKVTRGQILMASVSPTFNR